MGFTQSISTCMGKYANFHGRATRSEFWWFYLFVVLVGLGASIVGGIADPTAGSVLNLIVSLIFLVPELAVGSRRLHDTDRSGWWQLIAFTIVGIILLIIWYASEGKKESNKYGQPLVSE